MLNLSSNFILRYRLVCLLLSVGYFVYQFMAANYENFGIQFRYLTIWGLTGAMVSSYLLYRSKRNNLPETYHAFVSAVLEAIFYRSQFSELFRLNRLVSGILLTCTWAIINHF